MRLQLFVSTLLIVSVTITHPLLAQTEPPKRSVDGIKAILKQRVVDEKYAVGIVIGVTDADGTRVVGEGRFCKDDTTIPPGDLVFEIGSASKVFTSLLLADMVKRGEVALNDPVSKYLPKSVQMPTREGREITLEDLATHMSALPRLPDNLSPKDALNPYADYSVEQMYAFLSGHKLRRDIGEKHEYSNLGAGLLGHVLALRAGTDYESLVKTRICEPLGMTSTTITLTPDAQRRMPPGHNELLFPVKYWDIPTLAGAGAIRSTMNDMLKFVEANMGKTKSPLSEAMEEQQRVRKTGVGPNLNMALGWLTIDKFDHQVTWHNGQTGGFHSFIGFDKKQGVGVVVLANTATDIDDIGRTLISTKFKLKKVKAVKERIEVKVDPKILDTYVGEYVLAPTFVITITKEDDHLILQATKQPKFQIYPESETKFYLKAVDAQITFVKDDKGAVTKLILHQFGLDQSAKKK